MLKRMYSLAIQPGKLMHKKVDAEHERLKKSGTLFPRVFFREVAEGRGGDKKPRPIVTFTKA